MPVAAKPKTQDPRRKRVPTACDYCRSKRLKCTADRVPCMNCQNYNAECTFTKSLKRTLAGRERKRSLNTSRAMEFPSQEILPPTKLSLSGDHTMDINETQSPVSTEVQMIDGGAILDPNYPVTTSPLRASTSLEPVESPERDSTDYANNIFAATGTAPFSVPSDLMQPFDFWNPTFPLHEAIFLGGVLETASCSQISPAETDDILSGSQPAFGQPTTLEAREGQTPAVMQKATSWRPSSGKISGVPSLKQKSDSSSQQGRILPGLFIRKDAVNSNFIGLHSVGSTLAFCLGDTLENKFNHCRSSPFDYLIEAGPRVDEAGVSETIDLSHYVLPSQEFARTSIETYFEHVNCFYPIVDRANFSSSWEQIYAQPAHQRSIIEFLKLYLIIAIGSIRCHSSENKPSQGDDISLTLYQHAWDLQPAAYSRPCIGTVQITLLHAVFLMYQSRGGMAWLACGMAIRVAQAIGLHRRSPRDFELMEEQIRLRSQLWWVAFTLDAKLSIIQGRPTATSELSHDAELLPLDLRLEGSAQENNAVTNIFRQQVGLARIQNRFSHVLNRHETVVARLDALAELDTALIAWRDEIPVECRPEQEILVEHDIYHLVAAVHLEYFSILRALHWASTAACPVDETALLRHSNHRIRGCETICLSAARSFLKTLNDVTDEMGSSKTYLVRLHTDDYIAALAIIYRNLYKSPHKASAKSDLEYFRSGKMHLHKDFRGYSADSAMGTLFNDMLAILEKKVHPWPLVGGPITSQ